MSERVTQSIEDLEKKVTELVAAGWREWQPPPDRLRNNRIEAAERLTNDAIGRIAAGNPLLAWNDLEPLVQYFCPPEEASAAACELARAAPDRLLSRLATSNEPITVAALMPKLLEASDLDVGLTFVRTAPTMELAALALLRSIRWIERAVPGPALNESDLSVVWPWLARVLEAVYTRSQGEVTSLWLQTLTVATTFRPRPLFLATYEAAAQALAKDAPEQSIDAFRRVSRPPTRNRATAAVLPYLAHRLSLDSRVPVLCAFFADVEAQLTSDGDLITPDSSMAGVYLHACGLANALEIESASGDLWWKKIWDRYIEEDALWSSDPVPRLNRMAWVFCSLCAACEYLAKGGSGVLRETCATALAISDAQLARWLWDLPVGPSARRLAAEAATRVACLLPSDEASPRVLNVAREAPDAATLRAIQILAGDKLTAEDAAALGKMMDDRTAYEAQLD